MDFRAEQERLTEEAKAKIPEYLGRYSREDFIQLAWNDTDCDAGAQFCVHFYENGCDLHGKDAAEIKHIAEKLHVEENKGEGLSWACQDKLNELFLEAYEKRLAEQVKEAWLEGCAYDLESVELPVRVFDTGMEIFGDFPNGKKAAETMRKSDRDWWAMQERPDYRLIEELEEEDRND